MPEVKLEFPPSLAEFARAVEEAGQAVLEAHEELSAETGAAVDYSAIERRVSGVLGGLMEAVDAGSGHDHKGATPSHQEAPDDVDDQVAAGVPEESGHIR